METPEPPIHLIPFTRSVLDLLSSWPALQISLNQSSNHQSSNQQNEARYELATEIIGAFLDVQVLDPKRSNQIMTVREGVNENEDESPTKVPDKEELEDFLLSWVFGTLDVRLEDDSEVLVTKDLIGLWREWSRMKKTEDEEIVRQNGELIKKVERMAEASRLNRSRFDTQVIVEENSNSDGDDGEGDDDDEAGDDAMDVDHQDQLHSHRGRSSPIVDEDGFTLVKKSNNRR